MVFLAIVVFVLAFCNGILYYCLESKNSKEWKSYFANIRRLELEHIDEEIRRQEEDEEQNDERESIHNRENRLQENLRRLQTLGRHTRTRLQWQGLGPLRSQLYVDLTTQGPIQRSLLGLEHDGGRYQEDESHRNVDADNYFVGLRRLTRQRELRARNLQQNENLLHGRLRSQRREHIISELSNPNIAQNYQERSNYSTSNWIQTREQQIGLTLNKQEAFRNNRYLFVLQQVIHKKVVLKTVLPHEEELSSRNLSHHSLRLSSSLRNKRVFIDNIERNKKKDNILVETLRSIRSKFNNASKREHLSLYSPTICPICCEDYVKGDDIAWSKNEECCHAFHTDCIVPWLMEHKECPMCRCNYINMEEI
ncbi:hypothetical protein CTEN210_13303 [Chaetoceros tenuissimus]|uniref:RING-type domain-containing protein n=1 Tax=Chaetoceros tenuissimus TaxID=426638 RepID=A0AAD3D3F3_9STRA|nr:hypothetical protein CTEN210_13303 [Chaetoceros tenuissimus]